MNNIKNVFILNYGKVASNTCNSLFYNNGYNSYPPHLYNCQKWNDKTIFNKNTLIVSITRHPKTRIPSVFFNNMGNKLSIFHAANGVSDINVLNNIFHNNCLKYYDTYGETTFWHGKKRVFPPFKNWFNYEFNKNLKTNIFEHPFDYENKYLLYNRKINKNDIQYILILRYEDIKEWDNILEKIGLNIKNKNLKRINIRSNKNSIYNTFKKQLKYTKEEEECFNNSPVVKHFYKDYS